MDELVLVKTKETTLKSEDNKYEKRFKKQLAKRKKKK